MVRNGAGAYLVSPADTRALLATGEFVDLVVEDTGPKYLAAYEQAIARATQGALPPLGVHLLMGDSAPQKLRNAARNIKEGRTHPVQVFCRKPA